MSAYASVLCVGVVCVRSTPTTGNRIFSFGFPSDAIRVNKKNEDDVGVRATFCKIVPTQRRCITVCSKETPCYIFFKFLIWLIRW